MLRQDIKYPAWKPYAEKFDKLNAKTVKALFEAVGKRAEATGRGSVKRAVTDVYTIKKPMVDKHSKIRVKAYKNKAVIRISGRPVPAPAFKTKPGRFQGTTGAKRRKVDVMFKKSLGWHGIKNGFMWETPGGAKLMFERTTPKRLPVQAVNFMPVSRMVADDEGIKDRIVSEVFETMVKRFEYELNRRWKQ